MLQKSVQKTLTMFVSVEWVLIPPTLHDCERKNIHKFVAFDDLIIFCRFSTHGAYIKVVSFEHVTDEDFSAALLFFWTSTTTKMYIFVQIGWGRQSFDARRTAVQGNSRIAVWLPFYEIRSGSREPMFPVNFDNGCRTLTTARALRGASDDSFSCLIAASSRRCSYNHGATYSFIVQLFRPDIYFWPTSLVGSFLLTNRLVFAERPSGQYVAQLCACADGRQVPLLGLLRLEVSAGGGVVWAVELYVCVSGDVQLSFTPTENNCGNNVIRKIFPCKM